MNRKFFNRVVIALTVFVYTLVTFIVIPSIEATTSTPNTYGRTAGWIDEHYSIKDSIESEINGFGLSDMMSLTIADVRYSGATNGTGKVANYSKASTKVDNGYPIVDLDEARDWARLFNGNPSFMTSNNGLYGGSITEGGGREYTGYLLSKVAEMSGGRGNPYSYRAAQSHEKGVYVGVTSFTTTQRPDGSIKTDKTKYEVGQTVTITAQGKDYSIYNRGLKVLNYYIYNLDTGQTEKAFSEAITEYPISGEGNGSGQSVNFPQKTWVPTKAGNYEARILFTDTHARNTKNAPAVDGQGVAYAAPFVVGEVPPPPGEDNGGGKDPDPPPTGCKKTTMEIRIEGEKNDTERQGVPSGGDTERIERDARVVFTASKPGTFSYNGTPMQIGSGNNRKVGIMYVPSSGSFTVKYVSDDGTLCWDKQFYAVSPNDKYDSCPIVKVNGDAIPRGGVIEVMPGESLKFVASYKDSGGETQPFHTTWNVTMPDGRERVIPLDEGDNGRVRPYVSDHVSLPYRGPDRSYDIPLERGKTYKLSLELKRTDFEKRPECEWTITIKVKDTSCTIDEQKRIGFKAYGEPPSYYPPAGENLYNGLKYLYFSNLTATGDGYDTHTDISADVAGSWFIKEGDRNKPLSGKLAANERFRLILPKTIDAGDDVTLVFISDRDCVVEMTFPILSDRRCYILTAKIAGGKYGDDDVVWSKPVKRGETLEMSPEQWTDPWHSFTLFADEKIDFVTYYFDPDKRSWERKRDGKWLSDSTNARYQQKIIFPMDPATDGYFPLSGLYKVEFYAEDRTAADCDGFFFVQIGEGPPKPEGENLLIVKSSFKITPADPQAAGSDATITFDVKNDGKQEHDTKLAVRWESSDKATMLDVAKFKPGEVRKITVPTKYPQKSEDFIAHINPDKDKPDNETIWPDNRAVWPVKVTGDEGGGNGPKEPEIPNPPVGGGDFDGGEIGLDIYDSDGRQLQRLQVNVDGVWEREPAKIRVVIDQTRINQGFDQVKREINQNIETYKSQLLQSASGEGIKNASVTVSPGYIADAKSLAVYSPAQLDLKVSGPGTPQEWKVSSSSMGGDYLYTGTTVPTETTWRQVLNPMKYKAEINGFVITMDYNVQFALSYDRCAKSAGEDGEEGEETCQSNTVHQSMSGRYTITVKGSERQFGVFEPNAKGVLRHTSEWQEYTARDRYPVNKPDDFYAGERILTHVVLEPRHRHPVSALYPDIAAAQSWISETGLRNTTLQSTLSLKKTTPIWWQGPSYAVPKLGVREMGVDTPLMGDKQKGFKKDSTYAVHFSVQFRFGVVKGFAFPNKQNGQGHELTDYRVPFAVTANAWERQGIRNHTTR
ncbi:ABC transporter permease [Brevibacillus borstelensis]|uniref:ABC transporter permease n=1 Tax=Brevibacillus borstelensis TaxID=45462 RepID=UPI0014902FF7|nr:ABC transporter permease [Brevibacillus borstelensis]NOU57794.1 ABC transporter permease [Brevibacillus borstelensis]WNF06152.1 ABC transporter permease [Brevibacillus borstelensis]